MHLQCLPFFIVDVLKKYTHLTDTIKRVQSHGTKASDSGLDLGQQSKSLGLIRYLERMITPKEELRASLERHNAVFENLLRLIPAKYYILNDDPEVCQTWLLLYPRLN